MDSAEGLLLVDAENAFNTLNRKSALHNIQFVCPSFSRVLQNFYKQPARLFVRGGGELASQEGTQQGCPFAMPMYALALVPLISQLRSTPIKQAFYADDAQATGKLTI